MIYFVTPDVARPSGGVRTMYRCVDLLNGAGIGAAVLHSRPGFRCRWFENETRVVYPSVRLGPPDILVLPAFFLSQLPSLAPGVRKVVFNQNAYRTFRASPGGSGPAAATLMSTRDVVGVLVVSEDNRHYLEHAFPDLRVTQIHHWIDPAVFYVDTARRRRKITTMPRKRPDDFEQASAILASRDALVGWELEIVEGRSENEVAQHLRESVLFVSLAKAEGFGLPAAEAMACGCHVVGYHGMGGRELFRAPFADAIEEGDIRALATAIEAFVDTFDARADVHLRRADEAAAFIHSTYSRERATADLTGFFGPLAEVDGRPADAVVETRHLLLESRVRCVLRQRLAPIGRRLFGAENRRRTSSLVSDDNGWQRARDGE